LQNRHALLGRLDAAIHLRAVPGQLSGTNGETLFGGLLGGDTDRARPDPVLPGRPAPHPPPAVAFCWLIAWGAVAAA
jgi:hypothetical protein